MKKRVIPVAKKPYSRPALVVYGDIRMVTGNKSNSGADGATMGTTHSQ